MNIWAWILVLYFIANIVLSPTLIGKEREPLTGGVVGVSTVIWIGLIAVVFTAVNS